MNRDVFFEQLYRLAVSDKNIIVLTGDLWAKPLVKFKTDFPERYYNMGIAEQNMVSVAAGLALSGKNVFVYAIAAFLVQRAYEQIKVDICDMNLPVKLIGNAPGKDYKYDGPTHQIEYDWLIMNALPNMEVMEANNEHSSLKAVAYGYTCKHPLYIRLRRG